MMELSSYLVLKCKQSDGLLSIFLLIISAAPRVGRAVPVVALTPLVVSGGIHVTKETLRYLGKVGLKIKFHKSYLQLFMSNFSSIFGCQYLVVTDRAEDPWIFADIPRWRGCDDYSAATSRNQCKYTYRHLPIQFLFTSQ